MKSCPHCNASYADETLFFCLADGNRLVADLSSEDTIFVESAASPNAATVCIACGQANPLDSRFCKNCGSGLSAATPETPPPVVEPSSITPPVNYPAPPTTPVTSGSRVGPVLILIAAVVLGSAIIAGAVIYSAFPAAETAANNANVAVNKPANQPVKKPSPKPSPPLNTSNTANASTAVGSQGTLTTNQNIRTESNKFARIIGVHYEGARIEILEETSYYTQEGEYSTWYRVRVLKDGCDRKTGMGCGNDLNGISGGAAREGWMNARHISLD